MGLAQRWAPLVVLAHGRESGGKARVASAFPPLSSPSLRQPRAGQRPRLPSWRKGGKQEAGGPAPTGRTQHTRQRLLLRNEHHAIVAPWSPTRRPSPHPACPAMPWARDAGRAVGQGGGGGGGRALPPAWAPPFRFLARAAQMRPVVRARPARLPPPHVPPHWGASIVGGGGGERGGRGARSDRKRKTRAHRSASQPGKAGGWPRRRRACSPRRAIRCIVTSGSVGRARAKTRTHSVPIPPLTTDIARADAANLDAGALGDGHRANGGWCVWGCVVHGQGKECGLGTREKDESEALDFSRAQTFLPTRRSRLPSGFPAAAFPRSRPRIPLLSHSHTLTHTHMRSAVKRAAAAVATAAALATSRGAAAAAPATAAAGPAEFEKPWFYHKVSAWAWWSGGVWSVGASTSGVSSRAPSRHTPTARRPHLPRHQHHGRRRL